MTTIVIVASVCKFDLLHCWDNGLLCTGDGLYPDLKVHFETLGLARLPRPYGDNSIDRYWQPSPFDETFQYNSLGHMSTRRDALLLGYKKIGESQPRPYNGKEIRCLMSTQTPAIAYSFGNTSRWHCHANSIRLQEPNHQCQCHISPIQEPKPPIFPEAETTEPVFGFVHVDWCKLVRTW